MSLGFEVYESDRTFEKEGITGTVNRYTVEGMTYPCYIVKLSPTITTYKIDVLKRMFTLNSSFDEDTSNLAISIYFDSDGKLVKFGKIYPTQVKSFLKLFETESIVGFYNKNKILEGDYLYVLAD